MPPTARPVFNLMKTYICTRITSITPPKFQRRIMLTHICTQLRNYLGHRSMEFLCLSAHLRFCYQSVADTYLTCTFPEIIEITEHP